MLAPIVDTRSDLAGRVPVQFDNVPPQPRLILTGITMASRARDRLARSARGTRARVQTATESVRSYTVARREGGWFTRRWWLSGRPAHPGAGRAAGRRSRAFGLSIIVAVLGTSSLIIALTSGPAAATTSPAINFIVFGDAGTGSAGQLALRDAMVTRSSEYQFGIMTGDGAYPVGAVADYNAKWFPVYGTLWQGSGQVPPSPTSLTPKPIWPTLGNHDYDTAGAAGYRQIFALPTNGPASVVEESFYTFDVGSVHFVSFDSHRLVAASFGTTAAEVAAVESWLVTDLDANRDKVTIVYDHHPAYTAGPHHGESEETSMRTKWFTLFAQHGVDALFSGHDHSYQRNNPQSGLTSYVTGGGGGALTAVTPQSYTAASMSEYHFIKVSVSGCTISTVAVRTAGADVDPWSFEAPTCQSATPSGSPPSTGQLFSDGFESGDFSAWTSVQAGVAAVADVQSGSVRTGARAARFSAVATAGSYAYARKNLGTGRTEVRVALDAMISGEGTAGSNVPILRLYDTSGTRILSLYRQNLASDKLYVQHSGAYNTTTGALPLSLWKRFEVHVIVNGSASTVEIWADGALIHRTLLGNLGTSGVQTIQVGNDTSGQAFTSFVDDVVVTDGAAPATPAPSASTAPSATPAASSTPSPNPSGSATASPTAGTLVNDGFESGSMAVWTVKVGGGGTVAATSTPVRTGAWAARLSAKSAGGSYAYARRTFAAQSSLTATLAVWVDDEGAAGGNVPLLGLLDESGGRLITIYRQNLSGNRVYVSFGGVNYLSTGTLALDTWATLQVRVIVNGSSNSTVQVTLDGTIVHSSTSASISGPVSQIQIGNDTRRQAFTLVVDDVVVTP